MTGFEARAIREAMQMSVAHLARLMGVKPGTIYYREKRGQEEVPEMYALALVQLFQTRIQVGHVTRRLGFPRHVAHSTNGHTG